MNSKYNSSYNIIRRVCQKEASHPRGKSGWNVTLAQRRIEFTHKHNHCFLSPLSFHINILGLLNSRNPLSSLSIQQISKISFLFFVKGGLFAPIFRKRFLVAYMLHPRCSSDVSVETHHCRFMSPLYLRGRCLKFTDICSFLRGVLFSTSQTKLCKFLADLFVFPWHMC